MAVIEEYNLFFTNLSSIQMDSKKELFTLIETNMYDNKSKYDNGFKYYYDKITDDDQAFENLTSNGASLQSLIQKNIEIHGICYLYTQLLDEVDMNLGISQKDLLLKQFEKIVGNNVEFHHIEFALSNVPNHLELLNAAVLIAAKINAIQQKKENRKVNLYVDSNGGFRDAIIMIVAILNMFKQFKNKNIVIKEVIGMNVEVSQKKAAILDKSKTFNIYNLSSGISEFVNFGSADTIINFFNENLDGENDQFTKEMKKVLQKIKDTAEAFMLCSPLNMIKKINELKNSIGEYEKAPRANSYLFSMFDFLCERINDEFYSVFNNINNQKSENEKEYQTVKSLILHCLKHSMYQQALTIYSEIMPICFYDEDIFTFPRKEDFKNKIIYQGIVDAFNRFYESNSRDKFDKRYVFIQQYMTLEKQQDGLYALYRRNQRGQYMPKEDARLDLLIKKKYIYTKYEGNIPLLKKIFNNFKNTKRIRNLLNHANDRLVLEGKVVDIKYVNDHIRQSLQRIDALLSSKRSD